MLFSDSYENKNETHKEGVYCPKNETTQTFGRFINFCFEYHKLFSSFSDISHYNNSTDESEFDKIWGQFSTVPLFLIIIMFPLINLKSATFFTKFNALGK